MKTLLLCDCELLSFMIINNSVAWRFQFLLLESNVIKIETKDEDPILLRRLQQNVLVKIISVFILNFQLESI